MWNEGGLIRRVAELACCVAGVLVMSSCERSSSSPVPVDPLVRKSLQPRPVAEPSDPCPAIAPLRAFVPNEDYRAPKAGEPPLHRAARTGDHAALRSILASGVAVDTPFEIELDPGMSPRHATPLMVACGSGDGATVETVKILLDAGADVHASLDCGTPVMFAASGLGWGYTPGGDEQRLSLLIGRGAKLPKEPEDQAKLVLAAAEAGDAARLEVLLASGCPAGPVWDEAKDAERMAAINRDMQDAVTKMMSGMRESLREHLSEEEQKKLDEAPDDLLEIMPKVGPGASSWKIPLCMAAQSGSVDSVRVLLDHGADVNIVDSDGRTPIFWAWTPAVAALLLERGADAGVVDLNGVDVLTRLFSTAEVDGQLAVPAGCVIESGRMLAKAVRGADLVNIEPWPHSRLAHAAWYARAAEVEFLLGLGVPVHPPSGKPSALSRVCWHGEMAFPAINQARLRIIDLLVQAGADVNEVDENGQTPLHHAVHGDWGHPAAALALLQHGAKVDSRNAMGQTPLIEAARRGEASCVRVLLEHGADPRARDAEGLTAMDYAQDYAAGADEIGDTDLFGGMVPQPPETDGELTPTDIGKSMKQQAAEMVELLRQALLPAPIDTPKEGQHGRHTGAAGSGGGL